MSKRSTLGHCLAVEGVGAADLQDKRTGKLVSAADDDRRRTHRKKGGNEREKEKTKGMEDKPASAGCDL